MFLPTEVGKKLLNLHAEVGQFFYLKAAHIFVIARPLTVEETEAIEQLSKIVSSNIVDDWVCEKTVIHASCGVVELLDTEKAGYVRAFSEAIIQRSTISEDKELISRLNKAREDNTKLDRFVDTAISNKLNIPNPKAVNLSRYIDYIARAEIILGKKLIEEEEAPQNGRRRRRGPPVPEGYTSAEASSILSKNNAHVISPDIIDKENSEFSQNS